MTHESAGESPRSPFLEMYQDLERLNPAWHVEIGEPDGPGWIRGAELQSAINGPFNDLLRRTGERLRSAEDRRTIAALFALRYGWSAGFAIAPFITHDAVPDGSLDNVSFKFRENTLFEQTALHVPRGSMLTGSATVPEHGLVQVVSDSQALVRRLRQTLTQQAAGVVQALHEWSGFSVRGAWGMVTSSWASQFINVCGHLGDQSRALPMLAAFFAGDDDVCRMRPILHPVSYKDVTQLYQRRASCCRYYLLPQGQLCASCPLVSHDERLQRNRDWMKKQIDRETPR